jgi:hypothetical protein
VFPTNISGNTNAPCIMVRRKCARIAVPRIDGLDQRIEIVRANCQTSDVYSTSIMDLISFAALVYGYVLTRDPRIVYSLDCLVCNF